MINGFKDKIETHKAVVMIFNNKSDHLIIASAISIFRYANKRIIQRRYAQIKH